MVAKRVFPRHDSHNANVIVPLFPSIILFARLLTNFCATRRVK